MEFRYTSNSVYLRVLCEIMWTFSIIIVEFMFSMELVYIFKAHMFDTNWIQNYVTRRGWIAIAHAYLRASYIISLFIKTLLIRGQKSTGF